MDFFDITLEDYRDYLAEYTQSKNTLKNYVSDVRIFLTFLNSRHPPIDKNTFPSLLNSQIISEFESYLSVINPPATLNRRISSIKKFVDYYLEKNPLPQPAVTPPVVVTPPVAPETPTPTPAPTPTPPPPPSPPPAPPPTEPAPAGVTEMFTEIIPPKEDVKAPEPETAPETVTPPENSDSNSLLRLLPEEILPETKNMSRSKKIPPWLKYYLPPIISFLVGFVATLLLYPVLYP